MNSLSQKKFYTVSILYFFIWLVKTVALLAGSSLLSGPKALLLILVVNIFAGLFALYALIILIAYLVKKEFSEFGKALVMAIVVLYACSFADQLLLERKLKAALKTTADTITSIGEAANKDSASGKEIIRFGNTTPRQICYGDRQPDGLHTCRVCACPSASELTLYGDEPRCYFYVAIKGEGLTPTNDYIIAPCSPAEVGTEDKVIPNIMSYPSTKSYAVYRYQDQKLIACNEYRTWSDWDLNNAKIECEYDKSNRCVIQESAKCSIKGAHSVCEKEPEMPNETYRHIGYTDAAVTGNFRTNGQCNLRFNIIAPSEMTDNMRSMEIVPEIANGHEVGFRVKTVKIGGFASKIGIIANDLMLKIEGAPLRASNILSLYPTTKTSAPRKLEINRDGKIQTLMIP